MKNITPKKTLIFNKRRQTEEISEKEMVHIQKIVKETKCKITSSSLPDNWLCMMIDNNYFSSKELKKLRWWKKEKFAK